jgi:2-polyprenyl-6-methoxyphenol hydroxylase-like FAD-dependent oxidoreductase
MGARKHAIVIGGSIAGLWVARVLADHFEQVTIIDRDHFPAAPEARKGAPQGRQLHVLLMRGQQILDQLFPGISAELTADGVSTIRWAEDTRSYGVNGVWSTPFHYGYETMSVSRILLEWHMRRRLLQNPRIHLVEGRQVTALLTDGSHARARGIRMEATGAARASTEAETLDADLIIDASGRESRAPEWLKSFGYNAPQETVIDSHIGYATRTYQPPPGVDVPWKALLVQSRNGNVAKSGLIYPIENGRWMIVMVSTNTDLPSDDEAYLDFARSLPVPNVYDAIKDAAPLTPIYRYQRTANQRRYYGALAKMPEQFVVMGDAVCAFNPVFGQGMSVSAMEAVRLGEALKHGDDARDGFSTRFQKDIENIISPAWQLATSEDARNLKAGESVGLGTRLLKLYMDHLLGMVATDHQIGRAFFDVMHLLKPPVTLFAPAVARKIFRSMLTTREPLKPKAGTVQSQQRVAEQG